MMKNVHNNAFLSNKQASIFIGKSSAFLLDKTPLFAVLARIVG